MKLTSLNVENFKALGRLDLPNLGRVNLLVGKNNSGKTSVLEALRVLASHGSLLTLMELALEREQQISEEFLLGGSAFKRMLAGVFQNYAIDDKKIRIGEINNLNSIALQRVQYLYTQDIDADGSLSGKRRYLKPEEAALVIQNMTDETDLREALCVFSGDDLIETHRFDREIARGFPSELSSDKNRGLVVSCGHVPAHPTDVDELAALWDQIVLTDGEQDVIDALRLIEPIIVGLTFVEESEELDDLRRRVLRRPRRISNQRSSRRIPLVKLEGITQRVPLRSMGDGLHRVLDVVLRLTSVKNGFLLIDEFENGLHHAIHLKLWTLILKTATKHSVQVFATTHSADCLQAFSEISFNSENDGVLYRIAKPLAEQESHYVTRYTGSMLKDAISAELDVR